MIKPLRDLIVATPLEPTDKVGLLTIPENYKQSLRTHFKCVVINAGPAAMEVCPPGTIIHVSESWGDQFWDRMKPERKFIIGRIRDINGVCEGERIKDTNKYLD